MLPLCLDYRRRRSGSGSRSGSRSGSVGSGKGTGARRSGGGKAGGDGKGAAALLSSLAGALADRLSSNFNPGWGLLQSDGFHLLRAYMSPWTPLSVEALPVMRPRAAAAAAAAVAEGGAAGGNAGGDGDDGGEGKTAAAAAESPAEFAERVRRAMALALDAPCVDLGVEDWARLKAAGVAVDPTGTKVLWRPGGPGTERVEVPGAEEEEEEEEKKKA